MTLTVEVYSDVICPWCYIGKRRLEQAVLALGKAHEVQIRWRPFQLNPQMPKEGISRLEYRTKKFGSLQRSLELDAKVAAAGESDGLHFAFDRMARTPNTFDAHRLIWLAEQRGIQDSVVEGLFVAYFTDGQDIGHRETLIDIVAKAGLDRIASEHFLNGDEGLEALHDSFEQARRNGVEGVPFFVINREIVFSGAQPAETFLAAFHHAIASA